MRLHLPFLSKPERQGTVGVRIIDLGVARGPVYAVGDVHGCATLLDATLKGIARDAEQLGGKATVILLGDVIDRGPDSAAVLDLLTASTGLEVLSILGNHERMMLGFVLDPGASRGWLSQGGYETLASYGLSLPLHGGPDFRRMRQMVAAHIPDAHLRWLRALPHGYRIGIGGREHVFVHAGLDAGRPIDHQNEACVLWGQGGAGPYPGFCVVQGHAAVPAVRIGRDHVLADTGAWCTGRLSTVRFAAGADPCVMTIRTQPNCTPLGRTDKGYGGIG